MRLLWILAISLWILPVQAQVMTITGVKVSVTADSSAKARDKALEQAHAQAFQKLLEENFPESIGPLPPPEALMNMVQDFSIDREKATPKGYTASFTFQFDGPKVEAWVNQGQSQSAPFSPQNSLGGGQVLKVTASYESLSEWRRLKKALKDFPGIQKLNVGSFSSNTANVEFTYDGDIEKLQQYFLGQGFLLSPQEGAWSISSNAPK